MLQLRYKLQLSNYVDRKKPEPDIKEYKDIVYNGLTSAFFS